jgi:hypothetical protein
VEHLFLFCPFASAVWSAGKEFAPICLDKGSFSCMKSWLFQFIERASKLQATTMTVTCWHIWEARNDARHGVEILSPKRIAGRIATYVENIQQHCFKTPKATRSDSSSSARWSPPPAGKVCVNVDAAIFKDENRYGWGAVVRGHIGSVKLTCNEGTSGMVSPELAEALAIRSALDHSRQWFPLHCSCL